jgi:putative flippase GtrA
MIGKLTSFLASIKSYLHYNKLKDKEFFRYVIGGGIITLSNIVLYTFLVLIGMKVRYANLIAMIFSKTLGYAINKFYVYQSKQNTLKEVGKEASKYFSARFFTGVLDYFVLVFLVEVCGLHPFITKYVLTALIIVLNYLLGKYFVFVPKKS